MRALGRDHSQRADELRLSRLQGPRRTRLRDQRAEVAPGLVRTRRSARLGQRPSPCASIHLGAWKGNSANFAFGDSRKFASSCNPSYLYSLFNAAGLTSPAPSLKEEKC